MMPKNDPKKVLVTGAAGFLGRYVGKHFHDQGWTVVGIDSVPPENAPTSNLRAYHCLKLPDPALGKILQQCAPAACIHCAGRASVPLSVAEPAADYHAHAVLTFEVLEALRHHAPECKFVFVSSAAVYGNPCALPVTESAPTAPISPYGFHKLQGELSCVEYAEIYGLPTASARIFSAYGPGLRRQVLWDICRKILTGEPLVLQGIGEESRDFIHALDVARALHLIVVKGAMAGDVYNLASGREVTIRDLAGLLAAALGRQRSAASTGSSPPGLPATGERTCQSSKRSVSKSPYPSSRGRAPLPDGVAQSCWGYEGAVSHSADHAGGPWLGRRHGVHPQYHSRLGHPPRRGP